MVFSFTYLGGNLTPLSSLIMTTATIDTLLAIQELMYQMAAIATHQLYQAYIKFSFSLLLHKKIFHTPLFDQLSNTLPITDVRSQLKLRNIKKLCAKI